MVNLFTRAITVVIVDFGFYLANEQAIDEMALKSGKHYFEGLELVDDQEVAVFLFLGRENAITFSDKVAELAVVA